jgi:hypothetical protein
MSNANPKQKYSGGELVAFQTSESQRRIGNKNAVKRHGLFSIRSGDRNATRKVSRLAAKLWVALPWLQATDEPVVRAWCQLEVMASEIFACLMAEGVITEAGYVTSLLAEWRKTKQHQLKVERELGLTPASRASLGVDVARGRAFDLATEIAQARQSGGSQP